ncbi:hypothetical protein C8N24_0735 [Solirubrobacter pauli]|uniref:SH3 domain-containing protein n=1 Tax=Solirubrobacter pauli TaxID=166793 RepID=A0A660LAI2_9ACTN|nr:hypothetical protein [Solirubrobacter pauli]RKQ90920.1 hypothetical protein C8N24_0735 [Solirubrobacter pauli]
MSREERARGADVGRVSAQGPNLVRVVGALLATALVTLAAAAPAAAGAVHTVVDSDNDPYAGIYLRDGKSMGEFRRILERYMPYGTRVELLCADNGEAVGPYANRRWHSVRVADGAIAGQVGWIADRYLDTPNRANEATPGEPECPSGGTPAPGPGTPPPAGVPARDGASVYFSPPSPDDLSSPATLHRPYEQWRGANCSASKAASVPSWVAPANQNVTVLSGWSIGRLGPIYLLQSTSAGNRSRWQEIDYILLFDPGNLEQLTGNRCDKTYPAARLYTEWLKANASARLVILAGEATSPRRHEGIQQAYFNYLREHGGPRDRVIVCNYGSLKHRSVYTKYRSWITKPAITKSSCPDGALGWNP